MQVARRGGLGAVDAWWSIVAPQRTGTEKVILTQSEIGDTPRAHSAAHGNVISRSVIHIVGQARPTSSIFATRRSRICGGKIRYE